MNSNFTFLVPEQLLDGDLLLELVDNGYKGPVENPFAFYRFHMKHVVSGKKMGQITLRIGNSSGILKYPGHIGFDVDEGFRGHGYAVKATILLREIARKHGLKELWIGSSEDNVASRRCCEKLGAALIEVIDVPKGIDLYDHGMRRLCRYRLRI